MKSRIFNRTLAILLCALLFSASIPAQRSLGPRRLSSTPAPTLRNRTHIRVGLPRLGFVGRIGGVAFDQVASPVNGFQVNSVALNYSPTKQDGQRLSVVINNQPVAAPIYDWQLVPIAKFANSPFYSCFTLFGDLEDVAKQEKVLAEGGRILNYHPDFVNTLMGLRLFQLDNLIIDDYSWDLVKEGESYLLGAGESVPDTKENKKALQVFERFREQNSELFKQSNSYLISDHKRKIVFAVDGNKLEIRGEPSYYFWRFDETALSEARTKEASTKVEQELLAQVEAYMRTNPTIRPEQWLTGQLITEAEKYDEMVGNYEILKALDFPELQRLLLIKGRAARQTHLSRQTMDSLLEQLIALRILARILKAAEVPELSEKVSSETDLLRAINPTVWDAGVNLLRYAAFFRYCKQKYPRQWALFMRQIKRARPQPSVITDTVMEGPAR